MFSTYSSLRFPGCAAQKKERKKKQSLQTLQHFKDGTAHTCTAAALPAQQSTARGNCDSAGEAVVVLEILPLYV